MALLFAAIAVLNDAAHLAVLVGKHAPIAGGILQPCRQQRDLGTAAAMGAHELVNGFGAQQRHIAIEHQQFPLEVG